MTKNIITFRNDWKIFADGIEYISKKIKDRKIKIDIIVPIARGGLIPGRLLSEKLNINDVYCVTAKLYKGINKKYPTVSLTYYDRDVDFSGKNILMVDDISDSGMTIESVEKHFLNLRFRPNTIYSATMYHKKKSKFVPDFYYEIVDNNEWVVFPWENFPEK